MVILAVISIVGISITQYFWVKKAFDLHEKEFNHNVNIALKIVAEDLLKYNNTTTPRVNPVNQLSENYFAVMVNDVIDANLLEDLLKSELEKRNLKIDFEYGIYDCASEKMVYGNYITFSDEQKEIKKSKSLPKWENESYYFGVYFPTKQNAIIGQMSIWVFSSLVLLIVVIFFAYALFVILKQKRLSEIQKDFINNMTHEFKTPISTISISADVLKNPDITKDTPRLLNYATIISDEATRLKNQVERVLQMATIEKDEIKLKKETVDVHEIIKNAVGKIDLLLKNKKGKIAYDLLAEKNILNADKLHLTNIIYNLLDNAIKYSKEIPEIKIATKNEKNGISVSVEDKGIGISRENQKRIFEKFFRVSTGNVHDVKGFGLGLNYVKLIVKAHKGKVSVQSEFGKGSSFNVFLPFN